jgi:hypothetical protein
MLRNQGWRTWFIALPIVLFVLGAAAVIPGSALASGGLAITNGSDSGVTPSGAGDCTYTVNTTGASIVNAGEIDTCLEDGHAVAITDPSGDSGSITVDAEIAPSSCSGGASLSLNEEDGPVMLDDALALGTCALSLTAEGGEITQTAPITTSNQLSVSGDGAVTLTNDANAVTGSFSAATADGTLSFYDSVGVTLGTIDGSADVTIDSAGGVAVADPVTSASTVNLTAGGGAITQSAPISAATLEVASTGATTLTNNSNAVAVFEAGDVGGALDLYDGDPVELTGFGGTASFVVDDPADIEVAAQLEADGSGSLVSYGGTVTEDGGNVFASSLTVTGNANDTSTTPGTGTVSLTQSNYVDALTVTANYGNITAEVWEPTASLGNIEAPNGSVSVTNADGSLEPTGSISAQSIALDADGIAASGDSATLAAPSVSITDTDTSDAWTVTPSTVAAEGAGTIAYTDASTLSIDGGATFGVTPSSTTAMDVSAGGAGSLTYQAQGRTVSGTTTAPSGEIDSPGVDRVTFSGMASVTLQDAYTPPGGGTSGGSTSGGGTSGGSASGGSPSGGGTLGGTGTPGGGTPATTTQSNNTPTCTLRASSSKIALPKKVHGKLKGKATLTLVASCSGAVHVMLSARIAVASKSVHGKKETKSYSIPGVRTSVTAGDATKIVLDVPSGVVSALLTKGAKLSATFTLADTDDGDSVLKTISGARLT